MFTSYYGNLKAIKEAGLEPVSISIGKPRFWKGRWEKRLAPTWAMLKMSMEDYDRHYAEILAKLDPADLAQELGDNAVLLCWEAPGFRCHRRRVAEWFESHLGSIVPELGFDREATLRYDEMQRQPKKGRGKKSKSL